MTESTHDTGEERENTTRRDDHLEREFGITGRDYLRDSTHAEDVWQTRERERQEDRQRNIAREQELHDRRMREQAKLDGLAERRRERAEVSTDDRDGLRFRDAAIHSTAVGSLEGETASVGDEMQENTVDEEHPMGADAVGGVTAPAEP